ncbi:MAG: MaoC family dehydratase N-terminal domain-containing protein [Gammaproteobacteria bacterium]|nr:MaoC family dehydratase N-terminal domain-containing protein [Gammaproteobacteria bacterium]
MAVDRFPIEEGHIMMFARAIGDDNPIYHDRDYAASTECEGIVAPPTFVQSSNQFDPDYTMRPRTGQAWFGSGRTPTGAGRDPRGGGRRLGGGLHAEQRFEYHRHPRVGDILTATKRPGKTWEKQGRRSGKLMFRETVTEYRDQNGELVITATGVGVSTERPVDRT